MIDPSHRRLLLGTLAVVALAALAGCSMFFGGISDEELDREADYEDLLDHDEDVVIDVESGGWLGSGEFRAVYDLEDTDSISLSRSQLYRDQAIDIHGVRYWYPNGTKVTGSELDVDQGRSSTDVVVPNGNGTLAFSGEASSRSLTLPAVVEGSYNVTLPSGHRTSLFLFGDVNPSGYDRTVENDRERLVWDDLDSTLSIRHYQTRDVPIFFGIVLLVGGVGTAAITRTYRHVQRLREKREELGLDVELDDDDERRPPPGFR